MNEMLERIRPDAALLTLCVLGLVVGACSSDSRRSTEPDEPEEAVATVTDTFRGEMPQMGRNCHDFTLNLDGSITVEIIELKPLASLTVGLALGQPSPDVEGLCVVIGEDRSVRQLEIFLSEGLLAGPYCVCIFDVGNIFPGETISYVIEAVHP